MPDSARETCHKVRLAFWERWLSPQSAFPEARAERLREGRPLPEWAFDCMPPGADRIRILDLNAGPVSACGTVAGELEVELVPVDELAFAYDRLLEDAGLVPPVPTRFCSVEDILPTFGPEAFDLIFSFNGLDYTPDPVAVYRNLLKCLKGHGKIITFNEYGEEESRTHREWFRFAHALRGARPVIRQKGYQRDLADALPEATLASSRENGLLRIELRPLQSPPPAVLPEPVRAGPEEPLPPLLSMHIPKTAGSSFRNVLDGLYGTSLRPMYALEETAPRLYHRVRLDPQTRCLHGHFQAGGFEDRLPGAHRITWLRDPVERIVSSYFQFQRHPESARESEFNERIFSERWSLLEFARREEMRRQVRWYFNAVPLDEFLFIGISDRFEDSMRLFRYLFHLPPPATGPEAVNINPAKKLARHYALPPAVRLELEALYDEERHLYQLVRDRLDQFLQLLPETKSLSLQNHSRKPRACPSEIRLDKRG